MTGPPIVATSNCSDPACDKCQGTGWLPASRGKIRRCPKAPPLTEDERIQIEAKGCVVIDNVVELTPHAFNRFFQEPPTNTKDSR